MKQQKKSKAKKKKKAIKASAKQNISNAKLLGIIIIATFICYIPILDNDFLTWDDDNYILDNLLVTNFELKGLLTEFVMGNYHPLTMLVLGIEYQIFGNSPTGFHLVNLLIHLFNIYLVYKVVKLLPAHNTVALVTALFFGIHPLHVESVAWAAELKDVLYCMFFLLAIERYILYVDKEEKKQYWLALLFFVLSLLSKAMAASLPIVLILIDYFRDKKLSFKTQLNKIPFLALSLGFGILAIIAQSSAGAVREGSYQFYERIAFASYAFLTYLLKTVLPLNLSAFYPYPATDGGQVPLNIYAYLIVTLLLLGFIFYMLRSYKKIIFGVSFFLITIFLVLQLLPVGNVITADRYTYIPSIGLFYLAGEGLFMLWNNNKKSLVNFLFIGFSLFFMVTTFNRAQDWQNDITLFENTDAQLAYIYHYGKAISFSSEGKENEAMAEYKEALVKNPRHLKSLVNIGNIYRSRKQYKIAEANYNKALEIKPSFSKAIFNKAFLKNLTGDTKTAIELYTSAINQNSKYHQALINRGSIYYNQGLNEKALLDFYQAIPHTDAASRGGLHYNIGLVEYSIGNTAKACENMNKAVDAGYEPARITRKQYCN